MAERHYWNMEMEPLFGSERMRERSTHKTRFIEIEPKR